MSLPLMRPGRGCRSSRRVLGRGVAMPGERSCLSLKRSAAMGSMQVLRNSENAGWAHGAHACAWCP